MTIDEIVLDLIEISESLEEVAERLDDSTLARRVVSTTCEQVSGLVLDMAHELETDPHDREVVADGGTSSSGSGRFTLPVELPPEHRAALDDPPSFTDEQLTYLEAILASECCHMTGMHDPKHWTEDGDVCWQSMEKPYKRALRALDLEVPVYSAHDCYWCRSSDRVGQESPFDEKHPTYAPKPEDGSDDE